MFDFNKRNQQAQETKANVEKLDDDTYMINGHQVRRRSSGITKQELEESAWTIDKFVQDGQIQAKPDDGKRDPNTEYIPDDKNAL